VSDGSRHGAGCLGGRSESVLPQTVAAA